MTRIAILATALALMAGCAPTMDELSATCVDYGFKPQTNEFLECRQREKNAWEAGMNAQVNALNGALWM